MKNSLVLTLTLHELIHILYAHFVKKGLVKLEQYDKMSFTVQADHKYRCELFNEAEADILKIKDAVKDEDVKDDAEKHKSGRMIRIEEDEVVIDK